MADQAWQLLKLYLDRLGPRDGHVYYRSVASKLLSAGAALPTWLVNDYKVRKRVTENSFFDWMRLCHVMLLKWIEHPP